MNEQLDETDYDARLAENQRVYEICGKDHPERAEWRTSFSDGWRKNGEWLFLQDMAFEFRVKPEHSAPIPLFTEPRQDYPSSRATITKAQLLPTVEAEKLPSPPDLCFACEKPFGTCKCGLWYIGRE